MMKNLPIGWLLRGMLIAGAVLFIAVPGSAGTPDRQPIVSQITVNSSTGEILSAPSNYADVGAPDRSAYAASITVDSSTGEVTGGPGGYTAVNTRDRRPYAGSITVNSSTGEVTGGPSSYTSVGTPDRGPFAAAITIDSNSGEVTGGPSQYAAVRAVDRSSAAASVTMDPSTGQITGGPSAYDPTIPGAGEVPLLHAAFNRSTGVLTLSWIQSCESDDSDYDVYEGSLVHPFAYSHGPRFCGTGASTNVSFLPSAGSQYYLIVSTNSSHEGSYGRASSNVERPASGSACFQQQIAGTCQ